MTKLNQLFSTHYFSGRFFPPRTIRVARIESNERAMTLLRAWAPIFVQTTYCTRACGTRRTGSLSCDIFSRPNRSRWGNSLGRGRRDFAAPVQACHAYLNILRIRSDTYRKCSWDLSLVTVHYCFVSKRTLQDICIAVKFFFCKKQRKKIQIGTTDDSISEL